MYLEQKRLKNIILGGKSEINIPAICLLTSELEGQYNK